VILGVTIIDLNRLCRSLVIVFLGCHEFAAPVQRIIVTSEKAVNVPGLGRLTIGFGKPDKGTAGMLLRVWFRKMAAKGEFPVHQPRTKARTIRKIVGHHLEAGGKQEADGPQDAECARKETTCDIKLRQKETQIFVRCSCTKQDEALASISGAPSSSSSQWMTAIARSCIVLRTAVVPGDVHHLS